jgi:4-hydroxy-tetrahydrodipicolinate synthase
MRDKPEFSLLMGPEELLGESVVFGGHGGVAGGANINPRLFVKMYEAAVAGDLPQMQQLQKLIFEHRKLYTCGRYASGMIKGVKCALNIMGICSDFMAEPFHAFRQPERQKIKSLLHELNLF